MHPTKKPAYKRPTYKTDRVEIKTSASQKAKIHALAAIREQSISNMILALLEPHFQQNAAKIARQIEESEQQALDLDKQLELESRNHE